MPLFFIVFFHAMGSVSEWRKENDTSRKRIIYGFVLFMTIYGMMFGSQKMYDHYSIYAEAISYNEARASIVDYCDEGEDVMHILMDTDNVDTSYLQNLYDMKYSNQRNDKP